MELERATAADRELILSLFESSPDYFLKVEGCLPTLRTVDDALTNAPVHTLSDYKKEFLILRHEGRPIGTCEVHFHYPELGVAYIGLMQLRQEVCGLGLGRLSYQVVERYATHRHGCHHVRLGVSDDNDVSGFWSRLGFQANGRSYSWIGERKANNVVEYEKTVEAVQMPLEMR